MAFTAGAVVIGAVASTVIGAALAPGPPSAPAAPPPPAVAPTMDTSTVLQAQQRQAAVAESQSGRMSTILSAGSGTSDKLG